MSLRNLERHARRRRARVQKLEVPKDLRNRFAPYREDPVGFAREALDVEKLPPYQEEVVEHKPVARVAGHAGGWETAGPRSRDDELAGGYWLVRRNKLPGESS